VCSQGWFNSALDDGEKELFGIGVGLFTSAGPVYGSLYGFFQLQIFTGEGRAFVKTHYYVGAESILDLSGDFRI
jgi:hypothetical protein